MSNDLFAQTRALVVGVVGLGRPLDERSRRIALSALAGAAQRLAAVIGTLLMFPQVLHTLGRDEFGIWGAAVSLMMLVTVADFGISPAIVTLVSHALSSTGEEEAGDYFSASLITAAGVSVLILTGGVTLVLSAAPRELQSVYVLAIVGVAINVPLGAASAAWLALQRGWMVAFWDSLQTVFFIASLAFAAALTRDIRLYVIAVYGSLLAANSLNLAYLLLRNPGLRPINWRRSFANVRLVISTAFRYFILSGLDALSYMLDTVLALHLLGAAASAKMAIVQRVCVAALGLLVVAAQPLWPAFIEAVAKGDKRWVFRALVRGTAIILTAAVGGSAILVAFGLRLSSLWLKTNVGIDQSLLWVMAAWIVSLSLVRVQMLLLNALRIIRFQIVVFAIATSVSLILKFQLAPRYGVAGILFSTAIIFPVVILPAILWRVGHWRKNLVETV